MGWFHTDATIHAASMIKEVYVDEKDVSGVEGGNGDENEMSSAHNRANHRAFSWSKLKARTQTRITSFSEMDYATIQSSAPSTPSPSPTPPKPPSPPFPSSAFTTSSTIASRVIFDNFDVGRSFILLENACVSPDHLVFLFKPHVNDPLVVDIPAIGKIESTSRHIKT